MQRLLGNQIPDSEPPPTAGEAPQGWRSSPESKGRPGVRARENFLCLRGSQHFPTITSWACPPSQTSAVLGHKTPMGVGAVASACGCGWWHKQKTHTGCANDQSRRQRENCLAGRTPGRVAWGHKPLPGPWSLGSGFRAQPQHASNTGALPAPRLVIALEGEGRSPGDADRGREELGWWTHMPPKGQDRGCQAGPGP